MAAPLLTFNQSEEEERKNSSLGTLFTMQSKLPQTDLDKLMLLVSQMLTNAMNFSIRSESEEERKERKKRVIQEAEMMEKKYSTLKPTISDDDLTVLIDKLEHD